MDRALPAQLSDFVDVVQCQEMVKNILKAAKQKGAEQAEVGLQRSIGLGLTIRKGDIETIEFNRDQSLAITVYKNQRKGSASSTDLSEKSITAALEAALHLAQFTEADPQAGLAEPKDMAKEVPELDLYHPWIFTIEEAIQKAKQCEASAFAFDKRITNSDGANLNSHQGFYVYGNSHGFIGGYPSSQHSVNCIVIAEDANGMERDYQYSIARDPVNLLNETVIGREAAERTISRLAAQKLTTRSVPILFDASIASGLISHFLGAISGGNLFRESSYLCNAMGETLFPSHINLTEKPHLKGGFGSAPFDGDGVATHEKALVEAGVLKSYLLDAYSARKLKLPNTGNAGGVHNLMVSHGSDDMKALLKKLDTGLLVNSVMGQGINIVTGDYSRGATGFWVENGEIQYPVHEVTIAGNLRDMFKNIVAIGNDVDKRHNIQSGSILMDKMTLAGI